jgi:NAD(P)-dependent dehydrogenase (short-subunit alcohol dehydrogenase family)
MTTATHNRSQRFPARRALITGAASGLGLACAEILAREGWRLLLMDVDAERLSVVAHQMAGEGVNVLIAPGDVRDELLLRAAVAHAVDVLGGLDIAIHAAGVALVGPLHEASASDWQWIMDINLHGVAHSCRAVLPTMLRQGRGLIINVASAAALCTGANMSAYNTAKAAVVALSESMMQEYGAAGIQTVAVMPGFFHTRLFETARGPERIMKGARRLMADSALDASTVAEQILSRAARGHTHIVLPGRYLWLWRLKRLAPQSFQRWFPSMTASSRRVPGANHD